jgi:hypothetical protein
MAVSFTVGVKPHLAVKPFDYSDVPPFLLAHYATWPWPSLRFVGLSGMYVID